MGLPLWPIKGLQIIMAQRKTWPELQWYEMRGNISLMMLYKYDISAIEILLCYWKYISGKLMVEDTGLHGLGDESVEDDNVDIG